MLKDASRQQKSGLSWIKFKLKNLKKRNCKKTDDFISKIIKEIDTNGDGEISYDEFKQLMAKISK